ncbi:hypothetical protein LJR225_003189 [Phenylobacterium sp. LjRoot225]|uniref:hypothetical protein n=1 Tax=Phenylobacterium sp. LjRoot225 TaxID=3342285 RepID=UPI003ECDE551
MRLKRVSAGSPAPDLRESQIALDPESLWTAVDDGALIKRGMPGFDNLTRDQVMQLYAYIRAGAREALGTGKPPGPAAPATGAPLPPAHL